MKKYFVAYRYTGENPEILQERLTTVVEALGKSGIEAYCNLFDQHEYESQSLTAQQIMNKALEKIDESDGLFVLITGNEKSEGQLIEVGYALAKDKHVIVAAQENAKTYVPDMADTAVIWSDMPDLVQKLEGLQI